MDRLDIRSEGSLTGDVVTQRNYTPRLPSSTSKPCFQAPILTDDAFLHNLELGALFTGCSRISIRFEEMNRRREERCPGLLEETMEYDPGHGKPIPQTA